MTERHTLEIVLPDEVEPEGLLTRRRPIGPPGPGEVLVRTEATGVSFAEQQMRRGKYFDQPPFPFVPGYDLVGTVDEVGPDTDTELVGRRVAAITKIGAWSERVVLPVADLVPVPAGLDPAEAEAVVVNGVTALRMLRGAGPVGTGDTVLVLGANGGVGSLLVQLARRAGAEVVGTASARHLESVREMGAIPVDRRSPDLNAAIREAAPNGVRAAFDHVGGPGIVDTFSHVVRGGTLVSYGTAATRDVPGNPMLPVLLLFARLGWWNALPDGRRAYFFNLWKGHRNRERHRRELARDLGEVFDLLGHGDIRPAIAARMPLSEAGAAMALAESGTVVGKVVLVPEG